MRDDVDLLMAVRAPAPYLEETLASVCAQTHANWRLIAVVDGRDDEVVEMLTRMVPADRLDLCVIEQNVGLVRALNTGLARARAPFVARMDADDRCRPERLAVQVSWMLGHPEHAMVGTAAALIDAQGAALGRRIGSEVEDADVREGLLWRNQFVHPSVMIRRAALGELRYAPAALHREDYELWLRLAARARLANLPDELLEYRVSEGQTSSKPVPLASLRAVHAARRTLARSLGTGRLRTVMAGAAWSGAQTRFYRNRMGRLRGVA